MPEVLWTVRDKLLPWYEQVAQPVLDALRQQQRPARHRLEHAEVQVSEDRLGTIFDDANSASLRSDGRRGRRAQQEIGRIPPVWGLSPFAAKRSRSLLSSVSGHPWLVARKRSSIPGERRVEPLDGFRRRQLVAVEVHGASRGRSHLGESRAVTLAQDLEDLGEALVALEVGELAPDLLAAVSQDGP